MRPFCPGPWTPWTHRTDQSVPRHVAPVRIGGAIRSLATTHGASSGCRRPSAGLADASRWWMPSVRPGASKQPYSDSQFKWQIWKEDDHRNIAA
jgi:hypothetical protein